ncbi:DUF4232 domain-containing protein [Curtobacterium oceanosedimentum]|uniref:DUF4232 domain-containing protein n=1 Tax=Curtobacterium oceanosedimentum TaxID=465820 RepID=UPI0033916397
MHRSTRTPIVLASTGVVLALALTGCSSGGTDTAPTATETVTASATASSSPSTAPAAPSSAPSSSSASGGSAAGGSGSDGGRCATGSLTGSIESGSGGAAGSTYVHLALRNTGSTTCTLQGWPGVSFVGGGSGAQIGAPATRDEASAHPTVTLAPGAVAVAPLKITQAENYPTATCDPVAADGFRVYPPGSTESLFVRDSGVTACRSTDAGLLSVQGLVPEGQAAD